MSASDALLNLLLSLVLMTPFMLLSWWVIRRTPLRGLSGVEKWRAYRIRIGAGLMILLGAGLMLYFLLNLIAAIG
jgi:hypothetical protein